MSIDNDEAERLALLAQTGDTLAEERCIRILRPICIQEASQLYRGDDDNDVLLAEALYWAWRTIHIWDPSKGASIAGMARGIIRRKLIDNVKVSRRACRYTPIRPVRLDKAPEWLDDPDSAEKLGDYGASWLPSGVGAEDEYWTQALAEEDAGALSEVVMGMTDLERGVFESRMASLNVETGRVWAFREYERRGIKAKQADNALRRVRRRILMWAQESDTDTAAALRQWMHTERGRWVLGNARDWAQDRRVKFDAG